MVIGLDIQAGRLSRRSQLSAHERQVGLAQEAAAVSALRVCAVVVDPDDVLI